MASSADPEGMGPAHLTGHARDQWDDRTPPDTIDPWHALALSTHIRGLHRHSWIRGQGDHKASAVYGYGGVAWCGVEYYVVFLEVDQPDGSSAIVTAYQPEHYQVYDRVVREVERAGGPIDEAQYSPHNEHIATFYHHD
ncbi:hypothetical protein Hbl1158_02740 [Halobaculum sp. CBA1158]|uniref:hypothetical protein n=1 Tax=Halobaculum sp. CBA1158 TaxID=2904243 RepID=UPI001F1D545E|nr:hypothetical protein [Halobaculum sp. CBA1158]UIP00305.1 hypothetical protein Hbl1158_02740 [Halobaculum sp. CBA1158]